jgi:hypothetical protein
MAFDFSNIFRKSIDFHEKPTTITGTPGNYVYAFVIMSHSTLLAMRNLSKSGEKIKTHILCSVSFFFLYENRAVYEIMWGKIL